MRGSWSIGQIAGIPVRLHWSLLALGAFVGLTQGDGALGTLLLAVLLFASVVAHEVAHALVARRYGIQTRDIVLTPIGGIARLEGMPASGRAEVAIAIAGPIASLALAAVAFGANWVLQPSAIVASVLGTLVWSNAMLGLFNLIPAFPLDGGRVLRGVLHERIGLRRATDLAATIGRIAAVTMGVVGLFSASVSLVLIAIFVWTASGRERDAIDARAPTTRQPRAWDSRGHAVPVELVPLWTPARPVVITWNSRPR